MPWYGTGVLASGFGVPVKFQDRMDPAVDLPIVQRVEQIQDLRTPNPDRDGLMPRALHTIRTMRATTDLSIGVTGCQGPLTTALQIIGDFKLQGKTVIESLDIFARVGKFAALDLASDNIEVTDGWLRLGVEAKTSLPCISAIVVEGPAATRKINCGGPAYKDYEADLAVTEKRNRSLPCDDFYADWATTNFGQAEIGKVFAAMDGKVPQVTDGGCPSGKLAPVGTPWSAVAPRFAFVDELESFRPCVRGGGNLDRFDYWLNTFKYCRSLAQLRCALAKPDADALARLYADAYRYLLATVNTPGALAMVVNMENHPGWGPWVAKHAAQPWPKRKSSASSIRSTPAWSTARNSTTRTGWTSCSATACFACAATPARKSSSRTRRSTSPW